MTERSTSKYLIVSPADMLWGITATSTGLQTIGPDEAYPPQNHPSRYLFSPARGRTLDEFQFIYITKGTGWFTSDSTKEKHTVNEGDMIILFPGEWHSYCPNPETGWEEHWIGCIGEIPQMWLERGIISRDSPILHPGIHNRIINIYDRSREYANSMKPGYQKALGANAVEILGLSLYFDRSNDFFSNDASTLMDRAKELIFSESSHIRPEDLASRLSISYSRFRKLFKSYFGITPGQYILQIRIANAKEMLTNTRQQIQEIAWETGFENPDYFTSAFKHITGISPGTYRKKTRGE